jgi:hypothetical protein
MFKGAEVASRGVRPPRGVTPTPAPPPYAHVWLQQVSLLHNLAEGRREAQRPGIELPASVPRTCGIKEGQEFISIRVD